jgi:cell pole-organizing protein PopZ
MNRPDKNKPDKASEPSMEEILASIRKIIAEEPAGSRPGPDNRAVNPLLEGSSRLGHRFDPAPPTTDRPTPSMDRLSEALRSTVPEAGPERKRSPVFDDDIADLLEEPGTAESTGSELPEFKPGSGHRVEDSPAGSDSWTTWRMAPATPKDATESSPVRAEPAPKNAASKSSPSGNGLQRKAGFYPPSDFSLGAAIPADLAPSSSLRPQTRVEPVLPEPAQKGTEFGSGSQAERLPWLTDEPAIGSVEPELPPALGPVVIAAMPEKSSARQTEPPVAPPSARSEPATRGAKASMAQPMSPPQMRGDGQVASVTPSASTPSDRAPSSSRGAPTRPRSDTYDVKPEAQANSAAPAAPAAPIREERPRGGAISESPKPSAGQTERPQSIQSESAATAQPVRTLEDAVAEMLKPMLQQWLADNMPRIIEKALRVEATKAVSSQLNPPGT